MHVCLEKCVVSFRCWRCCWDSVCDIPSIFSYHPLRIVLLHSILVLFCRMCVWMLLLFSLLSPEYVVYCRAWLSLLFPLNSISFLHHVCVFVLVQEDDSWLRVCSSPFSLRYARCLCSWLEFCVSLLNEEAHTQHSYRYVEVLKNQVWQRILFPLTLLSACFPFQK